MKGLQRCSNTGPLTSGTTSGFIRMAHRNISHSTMNERVVNERVRVVNERVVNERVGALQLSSIVELHDCDSAVSDLFLGTVLS